MAQSSRRPAASTRASSPLSACVRSGPEHVLLPAPAGARHRRVVLRPRARAGAGARGPDRGGADHRRARGPRLLPAPRRGDPHGLPGLRAELAHKLVRSAPTGGIIFFSLVVERPDGTQRDARGCRPTPTAQLIAATNMKQRMRKLIEYYLRRPARLRRDRHAEPARVRPGLLREGRRRRSPTSSRSRTSTRRRSTRWPRARAARGDHRAVRRRPRRSRCRRPRRSSTSATRTSGWTCCVWGATHGVDAAELRPAGSGSPPRRSRPPTARSSAAASRRATCTPRDRARASGRLSDVRHRRHRPPATRAAVERGGAAADGAMRCAIAVPTASASRSTQAPGWSRRGSRSSTSRTAGSRSRPAAAGSVLVYNGEVYNHPELRARARARRRRLRTTQRHRGRAAPARARGARGARPPQRPVRASRGGSRAPRRLTLVRDRFGVRPLYYALLATAAWSSARRPRRSSPPARCAATPDLAGIDEVFTLWGAARAAHARSRRPPAAAGRRCCVWERRPDRRASGRWWRRLSTRTARRRRSRRADARQRRAAAARRRPGRRLPLRRPRLEPDHRARAGSESEHQLRTSRWPSTTRATTSAPSSSEVARGARHRPPRRRGRPGGDRRGLPRRRPPRRDAARPHRAGAAVPAAARRASTGSPSSRPARAPTSCSGATTSSRRSSLRELHGPTPSARVELLQQLYPYLGAAGRAPRAGVAALLARGRRRPTIRWARTMTRVAATAGGQGVLRRRRRRSPPARRVA